MIRVGKYAFGRFEDIAKYETLIEKNKSLIKETEQKIVELKHAQTVIMDAVVDNIRRDLREVQKVFNKERSVAQLLEACQALDQGLSWLDKRVSTLETLEGLNK